MNSVLAMSGIDAIHTATVLADCVDQLAILGRIMPTSYDNINDADEVVAGELADLMDNQQQLQVQFEAAMLRASDKQGKNALRDAARQLTNSTNTMAHGLKQSPLTPDNLEKVQSHRAFLEHILVNTLTELSQKGSFQSLVTAVQNEKEKKIQLQNTIYQEEKGRKRVKELQKKIVEVKREKETEIQQRNEMIAHLKDQLQEMKAKTNMEKNYVKKCAEVSVAQTQKKCNLTEKELREDIEKLRQKIDEETRVNTEIESFLRTHQTELEQKVEYWMEKYEKDVDQKQHELDVLKASKEKDLQRLRETTRLYAEYEQVVVEDRIEKEKARRKAEQMAEELQATIAIQSWFRGVMVRTGLGPYSKKKKKKGKKGKKSGKGKKKK